MKRLAVAAITLTILTGCIPHPWPWQKPPTVACRLYVPDYLHDPGGRILSAFVDNYSPPHLHQYYVRDSWHRWEFVWRWTPNGPTFGYSRRVYGASIWNHHRCPWDHLT